MSAESERLALAFNAFAAAHGNDAALDWLRGQVRDQRPAGPVVASRNERAAIGGYARAAKLSPAQLSAIGRKGGRPKDPTLAEITGALASRTRKAR